MKNLLLAFTFSLGAVLSAHAQYYPEIISVTGGTFEMGDSEGIGEAYEQPVHAVTLKTFGIAKTETTVLQWRTFCNATGREMPEKPSWGWNDTHPIVSVSWNDAVEYCDWLSDKTGNIYSLPTEAQWEYAARGGSLSKGFKFSGGQSMDAVGWFEPNSKKQTSPVAEKRPNELGLYDMSGNVWEWCRDWYGHYTATAQTNPKGPSSGQGRVLRGGSWNYAATYCRATSRNDGDPARRFSRNGFRVVSSL